MSFMIAVYCQPVGTAPQKRSLHEASSFEKALTLGNQLVANYHQLFHMEGYEVYCELIE